MYPQNNNYSYYPQMGTAQQSVPQYRPQTLGLKGRPVSSLEEARATTIDFDGSIFFFPDVANKKIYTKQINMDGTMTLNMYELKEIPVETPIMNSEQFITRDEFEMAITKLKEMCAPVPPTQLQATPKAPQTSVAPEFKF